MLPVRSFSTHAVTFGLCWSALFGLVWQAEQTPAMAAALDDQSLAVEIARSIKVDRDCAPAHGAEQTGPPSSWATRDEREAFLSTASVVSDAPSDGRLTWRVTL